MGQFLTYNPRSPGEDILPISAAKTGSSNTEVAVLTTDEQSLPGIESSLASTFDVSIVTTPRDVEQLAEAGLDAVVLDMEFGGQSTLSGLNTIQFLRTLSRELVIFCSLP
jgi:hypothetical protein